MTVTDYLRISERHHQEMCRSCGAASFYVRSVISPQKLRSGGVALMTVTRWQLDQAVAS